MAYSSKERVSGRVGFVLDMEELIRFGRGEESHGRHWVSAMEMTPPLFV